MHLDTYLRYHSLSRGDTILCEVCRNEAVDIHHILARQMGGSSKMDFPFNLIALCRPCHDKYGDKKQWMSFLISKKFQPTEKELKTIIEFLHGEEMNLFMRDQLIPRKYLSYL